MVKVWYVKAKPGWSFQGAPNRKNMFWSSGWMIAREVLFEGITVPVSAFA